MRDGPIDVTFETVGEKRGQPWYQAPFLIEEITRFFVGAALLGFAAYCFSLVG